MVSYELSTTLILGQGVTSSCQTVAEKSKSDAHEAILNKVHFWYFLVLIINYFIIIGWVELSWQESKCYLVQELLILQDIGREESIEGVENVYE